MEDFFTELGSWRDKTTRMGFNNVLERFACREVLCVRTRRFHRFDRLIKALRPHTPELYEGEFRDGLRTGTRNDRCSSEFSLSGTDDSLSDGVRLRTAGCGGNHPLEL